MKYFSGVTVFQFTWDQFAPVIWTRYPNPYSGHVLSEDVVSRKITGNKLYTKRLLCKNGKLPWWAQRYFGGLKYLKKYIIEESVVDLSTKTITTYSRNIVSQHWMSVDEKCVYTENSKDKNSVQCQRHVWVDSGIRGLASVIASFGMSMYKKNINKTIDGFNHVLTTLYCPEAETAESPKKSTEKLKGSAKKATEMAKNVTSKVPRRELNSP